ncbi:MAG: carboxypeptidase-like regulatory domain-containing protein, partial [Gammaproteobacteria bacterium]|nr:carboxypeptidase-like regulatory domain-containing protein [Gammaproteobacteria bacterium]
MARGVRRQRCWPLPSCVDSWKNGTCVGQDACGSRRMRPRTRGWSPMRTRSRLEGLVFLASALAFAATGVIPAGAQAQQGTITGQVTDAETGEALSDAEVEVLGAAEPIATNQAGSFSLDVAPGSHTLVITLIGYETTRVDGVEVDAGATAEVSVSLRSQALLLNPIVVTASRRQEKPLDAPATNSTGSSS